MGSVTDHKNAALPGVGSIADREIAYWSDPSSAIPAGTYVVAAKAATDEPTPVTHFKFTPVTRAEWKQKSYGSGPQTDGSYNHAMFVGWNAGVRLPGDGGVAGEPALLWGMEDGYWDGTNMLSESYLEYWSPDHATIGAAQFRPIYVAIHRNNNADHSCSIRMDVGTEAAGSFSVDAGAFVPVLTVSPFAVTFRALSGNSTFTLDAVAGSLPYFTFKINGATAHQLNALSTAVFALLDSAGRAQMYWTKGTTAVLASTVLSSKLTVESSLVVGTAAIATTATDGFIYAPSCAGVPTGVPTANAGRVPIAVDSTDSKLYAYIGGVWKSVTFA